MVRMAWGAVSVVAGLVLAGCSAGADAPLTAASSASTKTVSTQGEPAVQSPAASATTATSATPPSVEDWTVAGELAQLPESALPAGNAVVVAGNLAEASELAGVGRPAGSGDADAVLAWAASVAGPDVDASVSAQLPEVVQPNYLARVVDFRSEVGWDVTDVETYAEIQAPPGRFSVLTGSFDDAELTAAMGAPVGGLWSVGPGQDGEQDLSNGTAARPLGEGLRMAVADDTLAVSRTTDSVREWVGGTYATLADDAELSALAASLDEQQVYAAMMLPETTEAAGSGSGAALDPFTAMAIGLTLVDGEPVLVLTYHLDSAEAARKNAGTLRELVVSGTSDANGRPWSDRLTVREVAADGNVLTGTFTIQGSPGIAWRLPAQRDNLASHR